MTHVVNKYEVRAFFFPLYGIYTHEVQCWTSINGGQTFAFCGHRKLFRSKEEAEKYKKKKDALAGHAGSVVEQKPPLDGSYYFFECLEEIGDDGMLPASALDDSAAVRMAADHEAYLYMIMFKNGTRVSSKTLYEPAFL